MGFFDDAMTVYNYRKTGNVETWTRSVVSGIQWRHQKMRLDEHGHTLSKRPVESITVDFEEDYDNPQYISPKQYSKATDASGLYTLDASGKDILVLGECPALISDSYTLSDLRSDYDCYTISSVSDNTNRSRLRHIKVTAE